MNQGVLEQVGAAEDVYQRPPTALVADFVGASNRLAARVARGEGPGRYVAPIDGVGERPVRGPEGIAPDADVAVVVRPEKLRLAGPPGAGALTATVIDVSFVGVHHIVRLRSTALGELVAATVSGAPPPVRGEQVPVDWSDEQSWAVPVDAAADEAECSPPRALPRASSGERDALDETLRQVEAPVGLARATDRDHVRVIERRNVRALPPKALPEGRITAQLRRQHLERHRPAPRQLLGAVHDRHAADPD